MWKNCVQWVLWENKKKASFYSLFHELDQASFEAYLEKNPDILDPTCGAFKTFSEKWYANIKKVYALDDEADYPKFLGGDLFHESSPQN